MRTGQLFKELRKIKKQEISRNEDFYYEEHIKLAQNAYYLCINIQWHFLNFTKKHFSYQWFATTSIILQDCKFDDL